MKSGANPKLLILEDVLIIFILFVIRTDSLVTQIYETWHHCQSKNKDKARELLLKSVID